MGMWATRSVVQAVWTTATLEFLLEVKSVVVHTAACPQRFATAPMKMRRHQCSWESVAAVLKMSRRAAALRQSLTRR